MEKTKKIRVSFVVLMIVAFLFMLPAGSLSSKISGILGGIASFGSSIGSSDASNVEFIVSVGSFAIDLQGWTAIIVLLIGVVPLVSETKQSLVRIGLIADIVMTICGAVYMLMLTGGASEYHFGESQCVIALLGQLGATGCLIFAKILGPEEEDEVIEGDQGNQGGHVGSGDKGDNEEKKEKHLLCVKGEYAGAKFPLPDTLTIGRDAAHCQLVLSNPKISGIHCKITVVKQANGETLVKAIDQSKNGTFVNGMSNRLPKDQPVEIKVNDVLYLGDGNDAFRLLAGGVEIVL